MSDKSPRRAGTFILSVLVGAFAGITLQVLIALLQSGSMSVSDLWEIPVFIVMFGLFAAPFVGIGLAIFGLPAAWLLRANAKSWWLCIVAVIWGAVAGKLLFYAIDHLIFLGLYRLGEVAMVDLGVLYGVPTALAYWVLQRRELEHDNGS